MNLPRNQPIKELGAIKTKLRVVDEYHWNIFTWRQSREGTPHKHTRSIPIRHWNHSDGNFQDPKTIKTFPEFNEIYGDKVQAILEELRSKGYDFEEYAAIITNLEPGTKIRKHKDYGRIFHLGNRIHIPLVTHKDVIFHCGHMSINMKEDMAYEIGNTNNLHGVENNSEIDRHHLIIDLIKYNRTKVSD